MLLYQQSSATQVKLGILFDFSQSSQFTILKIIKRVSNGQGQQKPLSPLCVIENSLVKCTILFQTVSSKAEAPEFEKSIYNPSGMYGMKVGGETSKQTKRKGYNTMLNVRPWTPAPPSISIQVRSSLSTILSSPGPGLPVFRKRSEK